MKKKLISIVAPTYNEEENILIFYDRIKVTINAINEYDFEILIIDNASTDKTVSILKKIIDKDKRVKLIVNTRNFGHIRSPYWGIIQSTGAATIYLASDLQDPPELIPTFLKAWENGYKVAFGIKPKNKDHFFMRLARKLYYRFLDYISDVPIVRDATGFGIYDQEVINKIRQINDPYPFFRGLVADLGYKIKEISFFQERRSRGLSKNNFFTLYDIGMLGIISHSTVPIRLASLFGFLIGCLSLIFAFIFIILKLIYWNSFPLGISPIIIGMFFMFGIILTFIGILGEYIGSIHTYLQKRPIVVEKERINFD